jgi:hypothetical protein
MPQGSVYGLGLNKSVELVIPGAVLGGPVSTGVSVYIQVVDLTIVASTAPCSLTWS